MTNSKSLTDKFNEIENLVKNTFTDDQKRAILYSLLLIAKSDGEYHQNEKLNLDITAQFLNYNLNDFKFLQYPSLGVETMYQELNALNSKQKDWYVLSTYGMINADFQYKQVEDNFANHFFEKMGISEEYINKLVQYYQ
jgi:hypothetical protein